MPEISEATKQRDKKQIRDGRTLPRAEGEPKGSFAAPARDGLCANVRALVPSAVGQRRDSFICWDANCLCLSPSIDPCDIAKPILNLGRPDFLLQ